MVRSLVTGSATFVTRARTVDHLGREQIADCPTAISELWKNSWDAYSRNVRLRIHAEEAPVAVLTDDGHGMRAADLSNRWLVIGTEGKVQDTTPVTSDDRNGLDVRPRQGQKGIGRLSTAKLGSILLLLAKHADEDYVAALVDWRMFENPFLNLSEVVIATGSFATKALVFEALPHLANTLVGSVLQNTDGWRVHDRPLKDGWRSYDQAWKAEAVQRSGLPPSTRILQGIKRMPFRPDHLSDWEGPGTAMLVFDLDDTLKALPASGDTDLVSEESDERFERSLSNFVDPFLPTSRLPQFSYRADILSLAEGKSRTRLVVGAEKAIDRTMVQEMEHQIDGTVGGDGVFRGKLKAFGAWIDDAVEFELPAGLTLPDRSNTRVGPFNLFIASMEFSPDNSTHSRSEHDRYVKLAESHSGLMIYRDDLRVLPYGREDNDFFSIEYKRSKNAGRYFWNHRQMFGRIALTRASNPNLKDKAGREGFIDNTAAKTFRAIVGNILDQSARRYFGSSSDIRKPRLAEIQTTNRAGRAEAEAQKLRERERKQFLKELEKAEHTLPGLRDTIELATGMLRVEPDLDVAEAASRLSDWRADIARTAVRPQPSGTARLTPRYQALKANVESISEAVDAYERKFRDIVDTYTTTQPEKIVSAQIAEAKRAIDGQIQGFLLRIDALRREQSEVVGRLAAERTAGFGREAEAIGSRLATGKADLSNIIYAIATLRDEHAMEDREIFGIYVSALENVQERIDLETLASVKMQELSDTSAELDRLTALAQLGIAVEIAAHDLSDFDEMATSGLAALPAELQGSAAVRDIRLGLEGLTDQLRFLSPLQLSGDKVQRWITGREIEVFVARFFASTFAKAGIEFTVSDKFRTLRLFERPARVFPVFLNLVNNSVYWLGTVPRSNRKILFDVAGTEVVLSDAGPGISNEDVDQIFKLFFTRKQRSGRGVGLFLARANLAAGGHSIRYRTDDDAGLLPGAAFYIDFQDAQFETR